jgi:hypothetical protein
LQVISRCDTFKLLPVLQDVRGQPRPRGETAGKFPCRKLDGAGSRRLGVFCCAAASFAALPPGPAATLLAGPFLL